ncbi:MAG: ABC transporter permease [Rickettsia sp.]|nr:ABC transporter permease [Rickettsia sp.]
MRKATNLIKDLVRNSINILGVIGCFGVFCFQVLRCFFTKPFYFNIILENVKKLGFDSIFLVFTAALFAGGVLALHISASIENTAISSNIVPEILSLSIWRELGPVLISLIIISRVGSAVSAEISTMKVTEQIDALFVLSINPIKYLITTKILALIFTIPILVFIGNIISIIGGVIVNKIIYDIDVYKFLTHIRNILSFKDFFCSFIKSLVFSIIIAFVSCFCGFSAKNGAQDVGLATMRAVVISSIAIFIANYLVTLTLFI